jgi:hypothetical protein
MSQQQMPSQDVTEAGRVSRETPSSRNSAPSRLPNLTKLYHVPAFALRELLERREAGSKFNGLGQAELVKKAQEVPGITESDVELLCENYRYGQQLAFYLYLLPGNLVEPDIGELQAALDELRARRQSEPVSAVVACGEYGTETIPGHLTLLDCERPEGLFEVRFRYHITHRFLNVDEEPDQVLQSRYGFLWLDVNVGYLAILSRDEQVKKPLTQALAQVLRVTPQPIHFPKELLDKHFSIEKAKRLSYYDPGTGVRRSISGYGLWQRFAHEIRTREQQYARPSSLYDEEVVEGVTSGLAVTASKGKLYLTRTLPTSVIRNWARRRLPDLIRDVKELQAAQPGSSDREAEALKSMRLPSSGKAAVNGIVEALLQTEREDLSSLSLTQTALQIYQALAGRYFNPYLRTQCSQCEETAELCPNCESQSLEFEGQLVRCEDCGATISDEGVVILRCMNGHVTEATLTEAWSIAPNHWLQKRVARIFAEVGLTWDDKNDYFHIEGTTLYRLRRADVESRQLPPVVQTYISNFWDPVTGQVHAGGGDILVGVADREGGRSEPPTDLRRDGPPAFLRIRSYRNLDLWLRGNATTGYSVEARVTGGGSVPPQPFLLSADQARQLRLGQFLQANRSNGVIQAAGRTLFRALFPRPIHNLWAQTVARLEEEEGLRVILRIEPPELMALPWELLFEEGYIGQQQRFPIVRFLDQPDPPKPITIQPPLRVLVVVAQAEGRKPVDTDAVLSAFHTTMARLPGKVEVDVLAPKGRDSLMAALRQDYHVLHYIGHNTVRNGESYLTLGDSQDRSSQASAWLLGKMAAGSSLRMAVLVADQATEGAHQRETLDSAAQQLVQAGLPAAVVMPVPMTAQAHADFSRAFYDELSSGLPVDTAVQAGRNAVLSVRKNGQMAVEQPLERIDWAIPTLYMCTPDGLIVGIRERESERHMFRREEIRPTVTYTPTFHGPIYGPVHAGRGNLRVSAIQYGIQTDDLNGLFDALRGLVLAQAPVAHKEEAAQQIDTLQEAILEKTPNVGKMQAVVNWFRKHIPQLAGVVTSVILNPIVGKVVEAAGELAASEFREHFRS